jgi:hypothetical protein
MRVGAVIVFARPTAFADFSSVTELLKSFTHIFAHRGSCGIEWIFSSVEFVLSDFHCALQTGGRLPAGCGAGGISASRLQRRFR